MLIVKPQNWLFLKTLESIICNPILSLGEDFIS